MGHGGTGPQNTGTGTGMGGNAGQASKHDAIIETVGGSQLRVAPSGGAGLHREVRRFLGAARGGRAAASARAIGQTGQIGRVSVGFASSFFLVSVLRCDVYHGCPGRI